MGGIGLLLGCGAVLGAAGLWAACLRLRSAVAYVLATAVLVMALVVATLLALSPQRAVTRTSLASALVLLLAAALGTWLLAGTPRPPLGRTTLTATLHALRDPVVSIPAGLVAAAVAYLAAVSVCTPAFDMDVLLYHLPRAALWKQQHAVAYVADAPDERIDAMPPNGEIGALFTMLLSGGGRYVGLVQLSALTVIAAGVVGLARRFGLSLREGIFGAALFCAFPIVALQAPTALTDLAVAAPLVCAAYFLLGRTPAELAVGALAIGVALGTKFTGVLALPLVAVLVLLGQPAGHRARAVLAGAGGVVAGSVWYVLNVRITGAFDGGLATAFGQAPERTIGATAGRVRRLLVDLLDLPGSNIPGISIVDPVFTSVIAGALAVVCVGLLRSGRKLQALSVSLAIVPLALAGPLVDRWDRVLRFGYDTVAAIGGRTMPRFDTPGGFDAASSWYGPGLVALLLAALPLLVVEVRRGRLPPTTLVALASPPAFIVVLALVVVYDPLRGRFVAFPVALAVAACSVVLSVRPLARVLAGLAVVTLTVSVLSFNDLWTFERWEAQARERRIAADDPVVFRFFQDELATPATIAVSAVRDTFLYPLWDDRLRRTIRFVPPDGTIPAGADDLVVGPSSTLQPCAAAWAPRLATDSGWRIYTRSAPSC